MTDPHRMKIGAIFVAAVEMTEDEWHAIDPESLVVEAQIRQGDTLYPVAHMFDPDRQAIIMSFDTSPLSAGRAEFDVWLSGGPIPWSRNVTMDLLHGVKR